MNYITRRIVYDTARAIQSRRTKQPSRAAITQSQRAYTVWARDFCLAWPGKGDLAIDAILTRQKDNVTLADAMEREYEAGADPQVAAGRVYSGLWRR